MSDHIAHIAICDDTFRLASAGLSLPAPLALAIDAHREAAHMGSVTRQADLWSVDLMLWASEQQALPAADRSPRHLDKLAFVLGALTHRAADRLTKPITNCFKGGDEEISEAHISKIMQDLFVYREVYGAGKGPHADPFTGLLLDIPADDAGARAEEAFRVLHRRALISMHTIRPDSSDIHGWLDAFFQALQTYPKQIRTYAELLAEWDPVKVNRYLVEKHFYDRDDALIVLARRIHHGGDATADEVAAARAATDKPHSRYARALARALHYLEAAADLFEGRIGEDEAKVRFDIGVPELAEVD